MKSNRDACNHIIFVGVTAFATRLICHLAYTPFWAGDSPGYASSWLILKTRLWQAYDGFRPPGYPTFLGLVQWLTGSKPLEHLTYPAADLAVFLHHLAGIGASVLIYLTLLNVSVSRRAALSGALLYALLVPIAQFEMYVLPLALTASLLVLALWLFTLAVCRVTNGEDSRYFAEASGLAFAVAALTRAEANISFAAMVGITLGASVLYRNRPEFRSIRQVALRATTIGLPPLLLWMAFNAIILGQFTFTVMRPYNLTCTVYNLFDRVGKKDRLFGKIMVKYYRGAARIDLVNDAFAELLQEADKMPLERRGPWTLRADMCAYTGEVSKRLQRRYPTVYAANALHSFRKTFAFPHGAGIPLVHVSDPESPDGQAVLKNRTAYELSERLRWPAHLVMPVLYCLTMLFSPVALIAVLTKRREPTPASLMVCGIAISAVGTFMAYCLVSTYFWHYGIVFFGPIVICGVAACDFLVRQVLVRNRLPAFGSPDKR